MNFVSQFNHAEQVGEITNQEQRQDHHDHKSNHARADGALHSLGEGRLVDAVRLVEEDGEGDEEGNHNDNEIEENAPDGVKVDRATAESEDLTGRDSAVVVHIERKKNDARQSKKNGNSL